MRAGSSFAPPYFAPVRPTGSGTLALASGPDAKASFESRDAPPSEDVDEEDEEEVEEEPSRRDGQRRPRSRRRGGSFTKYLAQRDAGRRGADLQAVIPGLFVEAGLCFVAATAFPRRELSEVSKFCLGVLSVTFLVRILAYLCLYGVDREVIFDRHACTMLVFYYIGFFAVFLQASAILAGMLLHCFLRELQETIQSNAHGVQTELHSYQIGCNASQTTAPVGGIFWPVPQLLQIGVPLAFGYVLLRSQQFFESDPRRKRSVLLAVLDFADWGFFTTAPYEVASFALILQKPYIALAITIVGGLAYISAVFNVTLRALGFVRRKFDRCKMMPAIMSLVFVNIAPLVARVLLDIEGIQISYVFLVKNAVCSFYEVAVICNLPHLERDLASPFTAPEELAKTRGLGGSGDEDFSMRLKMRKRAQQNAGYQIQQALQGNRQARAELRTAFAVFDDDRDGLISEDELRRALRMADNADPGVLEDLEEHLARLGVHHDEMALEYLTSAVLGYLNALQHGGRRKSSRPTAPAPSFHGGFGPSFHQGYYGPPGPGAPGIFGPPGVPPPGSFSVAPHGVPGGVPFGPGGSPPRPQGGRSSSRSRRMC